MESFTVNICQKKKGSVWQSRTRTTGIAPLLRITGENPDPFSTKCRKCSRIVHAIVSSSGNRILTSDRNGFVHVFDLSKNKFWLLCSLGSCSSALAFTPLEERDVLIGTSDCKLHLYESASCNEVACLTGHTTCISRISVDDDGRHALTCSPTEALLWDLLTLTALQQLALQEGASIIDAFFVASGEAIITALNGFAIGMWDATTMDHVMSYKMPGDAEELAIRTVDASTDGKYLAAAGRTDWIVLWELSSPERPQLMAVSRNIVTIKQIEFLYVQRMPQFDYNHILLVLNHNGFLHLYNLETSENVFDVKLDNDRILNVHAAGGSGRFVACTCSGRVHVYDFKEIYLAKERRHPTKSVPNQPDGLNPDVSEQSVGLSSFTVERLKGIVKEFGAYPEKYRYLIWRSLLSLPNNDTAYQALASRGIHRAYEDIASKYPISNKTLLRALQRVLSMLVYWCPKLLEVDYLAILAFPFVKLFHTNLQQCLETIIAFLRSWCQNWFCYFPNAPYNIFAAIENVLATHDASLLLHLVRHGVTAQIYAWSILQSVFSEVISKEELLQLLDHIFSNPPSFLLYAVAAFNIAMRRELLRCRAFSEFGEFYQQHQSAASIRDVIKTTYRLQSSSDKTLRDSVSHAIGSFTRIQPGSTYPPFDNFPKLAIDLQDENRQLQEEIEYFKKRQEILLGDTVVVTKNPCTCDGKRNDMPHLSRVHDAKKKNTKIIHLFERTPSPSAPRATNVSWKQVDAPDRVHLQGKEAISRHHSDVVRDVLRTRRKVAAENMVKHRTVADEWNYEML